MAGSIKRLLNYKIRNDDLESRFRLERLAYDKVQAKILVSFVFVIFVAFVFLDLLLSIDERYLAYATTARVIGALISLVAFWFIHTLSTPRAFDIVMLVFSLSVLSSVVALGAVTPDDFITLISWDVFAIFIVYSSIPMRLSFQVISAGLLSTGNAYNWLVLKNPDWPPFETGSMITAYLMTNVFGIYLSIRFKLANRKQFLLLMREKTAKVQLETALADINVLQGIIPICAYCKKIRNDEGIFELAEAYISRHTEADFSHTYCPSCVEKHFSEIKPKKTN